MQSTSVEPVSRKRTRNVGPGRFIQHTAESKYDMLVSSMTIIAHNFCVLLVHITSTHRPGSDATVGERSNFKKIPTHTQDHGDA